jgi:hypothetical protein
VRPVRRRSARSRQRSAVYLIAGADRGRRDARPTPSLIEDLVPLVDADPVP